MSAQFERGAQRSSRDRSSLGLDAAAIDRAWASTQQPLSVERGGLDAAAVDHTGARAAVVAAWLHLHAVVGAGA